MEIKLNSKITKTDKSNVRDLVYSLNLEEKHIVIELNLKILKKAAWEQTELHDGDNVEIITFMGGG